jgi:2-haloacid dehalogenase
VKVFKPDPRVYQLVGQRFRRATDEIGFVSSNSWDINGAGAAGLYTVWIRRQPEEPEEELGFPAQRILSALTELETVITQDS